MYRKVGTYDDSRKLQADLDALDQWSIRWQMNFNVKKCHLLSARKRTHTITNQYILKGKVLEPVEHYPYLGVELESNMKWDHHIKQITAKANQTLGFLRRNFSKCPQKVKEHVYHVLVRPHLEYASAAWDPHLDKDVKKVESVQRNAARFVKNNYVREQGVVTNLLKDLGWPSLQDRRKYHRLEMFYSIINGQSSLQIPNYLYRPVKRETRTLDSGCFIHTKTTLDIYRHSYFPRTILDWNLLPSHIRQSETKASFLAALKQHLF